MEKIIGGKPEQRQQAREELKNDFERGYPKIEPYELVATPEEERIIDLVQEKIIALAEEYGGNADKLPRNKIHIARMGSLNEITKGEIKKGMHVTYSRDVMVERSDSHLIFARSIAHELLHDVGKRVFQIDDDGFPVPYQTGSSFFNKPNADVHYLADLDEAVIEELAYKLVESLKDNPLFADEYRVIMRVRDLLKEVIMREDLNDVKKEEKVKKFNELLGLPHWGLISKKLDGDVSIDEKAGYVEGVVEEEKDSLWKNREEERQKLELLIDEIVKKHPRNLSKEEIFEMFVKFHFGGHSPIGKIIEEALGKGSFIKVARDFSTTIR